MATISSAGVGSGLDVNGIVSQLMTIEKQPLTALDKKEADYQAKLSAFGTLKSAVSALQSAATALKAPTLYAGLSAASSNTAVLTASANTAASAGSYAIDVVTKAQAQSISSQAFSSLSSDISTVDGKIKIELGTFAPATTLPPVAASFTADPAKSAITIDVAATGSSLQEVRDAINAANAGVKASIVYVGSAGYKLTLAATDSGAKSSIKLTVLDTGNVVQTNNADLAKLSFDPTLTSGSGNEFDINVSAQDAHLKINGLDVYRTTNTISDALTGVTLTATGPGSSTLTISNDTTSVTSAFNTFVSAYNDLNKQLHDLTAYNQATGKGALLTGDSTANALQSALRGLITASRTVSPGGLRNFSNLGIAVQRDGSLTFDSSKLASALASSPANVSALLTTSGTSSNGLALRAANTLDGIIASTGILASRSDGINRTIAGIGKQRDRLSQHLVDVEARYRKQYSALDTLVAGFQQTSQYLTQQLANLPKTSG